MKKILFGIVAMAMLTDNAIAAEPVAKKTFCHEGKCIPRLSDTHSPQHFLNHPILKAQEGEKALASVSGSITTFTVPCDSMAHTSPWYTVGADASELYVVKAAPGCDIQTTAWNRNHWTMTCWTSGFGDNYTNYECHNWNTIWGDAWKISFTAMACPTSGCTTTPEAHK